MATLLQIASRVEAAVEAYTPVRDFADQGKWRKMFKKELKKVTFELRSHSGTPTKDNCPLHPTLIALNMVLMGNEDLREINRSYPQRKRHAFYNAEATFPEDISGLVDQDNRWWEGLAEADRRRHASQSTSSQPAVPPALQVTSLPPDVPPAPQTASPQPAVLPALQVTSPPPDVPPAPPIAPLQFGVPPARLPRVNLVLPEPPAQGEEEPDKGMPMDVDEAPQPKRRGRPKGSKGAPAKRKRPDSPAAAGGTSKRRAQSGGSGANSAERGTDDAYALQCDRCTELGQVCKVDPDGACGQCREKKHKCSLVPRNTETGKADRHRYSRGEILEFRLTGRTPDAAAAEGEQGAVDATGKQGKAAAAEKRGAATAKGKQRAAAAKEKQPAAPTKRSKRIRGSPEASEPEASNPAPSPSTSLAALRTLALDSGESSAANTPADSPATHATIPRLPLPKRSATKGSHASQSSGVEMSPPRFNKPGRPRALPSPTDASPANDSGSTAARIAALEKQVESYERERESLEEWKRDVENRLKKLGA